MSEHNIRSQIRSEFCRAWMVGDQRECNYWMDLLDWLEKRQNLLAAASDEGCLLKDCDVDFVVFGPPKLRWGKPV